MALSGDGISLQQCVSFTVAEGYFDNPEEASEWDVLCRDPHGLFQEAIRSLLLLPEMGAAHVPHGGFVPPAIKKGESLCVAVAKAASRRSEFRVSMWSTLDQSKKVRGVVLWKPSVTLRGWMSGHGDPEIWN